jgi:hypothetical protein
MLQDILSTCTALCILYESYQSDLYPTMYVLPMTFFAYDLICNNLSLDFKIHHAITSSFAVVGLLHPYTQDLRLIMGRVEWSTLLLNSIPYVPKQYQNFLRFLFFLLFFKFRIVDWYVMFQENTFSTLQLIPIIALYSLNLYWLVVICKKIAKPLKTLHLQRINQHIVSYTLMINSILMNLWYPTLTFMNSMSVLLGISSYLYHNEIAYHYYGIPSNQSKWLILDVTVFHVLQTGYIYLLKTGWSVVSLYIHFINLMYIYKFLPSDITIASIPSFALDVLYLLYSNPTIELFTISLLIFYIHILNPFYDISYVSTHFVLCWYIHTRGTHLLSNY